MTDDQILEFLDHQANKYPGPLGNGCRAAAQRIRKLLEEPKAEPKPKRVRKVKDAP